ncbi:MAG: hypothetical protein ABI668_14515 [Sphingorhabdus sp.]
MAPDRALLHPANRLPHILAGLDIVAGEKHFAGLRAHFLGHWRGLLVNLCAEQQHHAKHDDHTDAEDNPEPLD